MKKQAILSIGLIVTMIAISCLVIFFFNKTNKEKNTVGWGNEDIVGELNGQTSGTGRFKTSVASLQGGIATLTEEVVIENQDDANKLINEIVSVGNYFDFQLSRSYIKESLYIYEFDECYKNIPIYAKGASVLVDMNTNVCNTLLFAYDLVTLPSETPKNSKESAYNVVCQRYSDVQDAKKLLQYYVASDNNVYLCYVFKNPNYIILVDSDTLEITMIDPIITKNDN